VSESSHQWFKGCAIGCGGLIVLGVLGIVGMSVSMRSAFDDAQEDRRVLEERYGGTDSFTPTIDGSVPADRVEAFLRVRDALVEIHTEIEDVDREMGSFEEMAEGDEEPPLREALPAVFGLTRSMMGLPFLFGEIERTRNRALVDAEMSLSEYAYIYTMAYHRQMVGPTDTPHLFASSAANSRVRAELRRMTGRQLDAARGSPNVDAEWLGDLAAELEALEADEDRIPWQDGLPPAISASLEAHRERLDGTYSAAAAEFDLLNSAVHNGGLRIEMN
jgi:hypothetical protein